MRTREDIILPLVRGKKVLDCGGVDHEAFETKQSEGTWLHAKVAEVAAVCTGLDIRDAAVEQINAAGRYHFVAGNAEQLAFDEEFDVVVAGEFIEHLYNPGNFLDGVWRALRPGGRIILTTPNATGATFLGKALLLNKERGHPEHTMIFSPDTLRYLVSRHGFEVETLETVGRPARLPIVATFRDVVGRVRPLMHDVIVLVARKSSPATHYQGLPGRG